MPVRTLAARPRPQPGAIEVEVGGRPVLAFATAPHRACVGLVMHPLGRVVDVSVQPVAACTTLRDAAERVGRDPAPIEAEAHAALVEARARCRSWAPPEGLDLLAGFGGAAFPLLAASYDAGAAPLAEVPRWAEAVLAATTAREGADAGFGDRATRPVVRSLVQALLPDASGQVGLANLALGLIGRDVLPPDRLARVLGAERPSPPIHPLPDPATLERARRTVAAWGPVRAERVLVEAATRPDGLGLLLATVRWADQLRGHGPDRLPNRLQELHDVHRARIATEPPAPPRPRPPAPRRTARPAGTARSATVEPRRIVLAPDPVPASTPARRAAPSHPVLAPPRAPATQTSGELSVSPAVRAIDGQQVDGLTFVVPRTAADLERWGRILANCLGSFGPAMAAGRSTIIGIERSGCLAYAVELTPTGAIRQFNGHANRPPDDTVRALAVQALATAGLLALDDPRNARWTEGGDAPSTT